MILKERLVYCVEGRASLCDNQAMTTSCLSLFITQLTVSLVFTTCLFLFQVLETCVKNCGRRFHMLVTNKDFVQEMVKLIGPKNDPPPEVQEKVIFLTTLTYFQLFNYSPLFCRYSVLFKVGLKHFTGKVSSRECRSCTTNCETKALAFPSHPSSRRCPYTRPSEAFQRKAQEDEVKWTVPLLGQLQLQVLKLEACHHHNDRRVSVQVQSVALLAPAAVPTALDRQSRWPAVRYTQFTSVPSS